MRQEANRIETVDKIRLDRENSLDLRRTHSEENHIP